MPSRATRTEAITKEALNGDLSFKGGPQPHPLLGIHPYAARFPSGLPTYFIERLSNPRQVVLDPTCGSGTTLLEALVLGRNTIGVDIDPLATMQSQARTQRIKPSEIWNAGYRAWQNAGQRLERGSPWQQAAQQLDDDTREFIERWFHPETRNEMAALAAEIEATPQAPTRNALRVILSSMVISNRSSVSRAIDIAHSRPHRRPDARRTPAIGLFRRKLNAAARAYQHAPTDGRAAVIRADARRLPISDESCDLVLWSPPYANALDYMRGHKFALVWLGISLGDTSRLARHYMGTERTSPSETRGTTPPAAATAATKLLADQHPKLAAAVAQYCHDLEATVRETARVLRPGSASVTVVAPSTLRGVPIPTHEILTQFLENASMRPVAVSQRPLDRNRRMMPARDRRGDGIENRMRTEYVIGAVKPD